MGERACGINETAKGISVLFSANYRSTAESETINSDRMRRLVFFRASVSACFRSSEKFQMMHLKIIKFDKT